MSGISSAAASDVNAQVQSGDKLLAVDDALLRGKAVGRCGWDATRDVLRVGEKGGYDDGIHDGRRRTDKSCAGSIATHPCKKRKDGALSVGMVQCKDGPPAVNLLMQ